MIDDRHYKPLHDQLSLLLASYSRIGFEIKILEHSRTSECSVIHIPSRQLLWFLSWLVFGFGDNSFMQLLLKPAHFL